jgi:hypothetical protein
MTGPREDGGRKVGSLRELPQAIEPPRELWPRIEARLEALGTLAPAPTRVSGSAPHGRRARLRWLAAAALVASVAVGVWIGRSLLPGSAPLSARQAARGTVTLPGPTALDASYVSDPRYQQQRAALLAQLEARMAALSPATRAKVTASLATIEQAKEDLEHALGKDPSNALLQELLINTYQDEMRVLTDVREASESGRGI